MCLANVNVSNKKGSLVEITSTDFKELLIWLVYLNFIKLAFQLPKDQEKNQKQNWKLSSGGNSFLTSAFIKKNCAIKVLTKEDNIGTNWVHKAHHIRDTQWSINKSRLSTFSSVHNCMLHTLDPFSFLVKHICMYAYMTQRLYSNTSSSVQLLDTVVLWAKG